MLWTMLPGTSCAHKEAPLSARLINVCSQEWTFPFLVLFSFYFFSMGMQLDRSCRLKGSVINAVRKALQDTEPRGFNQSPDSFFHVPVDARGSQSPQQHLKRVFVWKETSVVDDGKVRPAETSSCVCVCVRERKLLLQSVSGNFISSLSSRLPGSSLMMSDVSQLSSV